MKKLKLSLLLFAATLFQANAQSYLGYSSSNYAGVHSIDINPAEIADSRFVFDVNLVGFQFDMENNFLGLDAGVFKKSFTSIGKLTDSDPNNDPPEFKDKDFNDKYLQFKEGNHIRQVFVNAEVMGPSFMFTLAKNRIGIGFTSKLRSVTHIDGVEAPLAKLAFEELKYPSLWKDLNNKYLSVQTNAWAEYGPTFAMVVKDDNEHFFKVGGRVKLLQGLGSAYTQVNDLNYHFSDDTTLTLIDADVKYGHSTNFEFDGTTNNWKYQFVSNPGVGFDIGGVYEWRPDYKDYKYEMDGDKDRWMHWKTKYKLKVGLSLNDVGGMTYQKGGISGNYKANISLWNLHDFDGAKNIADYDSILNSKFGLGDVAKKYRMSLPTNISLQADYQIWKNIYVNLNGYWALKFKKDPSKISGISRISITPRWDWKWMGAFIPVSYNALGNFQAGLGLRFGPFVVGTMNINGLVSNAPVYSSDFYAAVKVPFLRIKPKDRDNDKVSDKMDKCIDKPGVWEFLGCPDTDGDHIQDTQDKCPLVAGLPEFEGCPDTDGDKIPDPEDDCIEEPGLPEFKGCPDTDKDGIKDSEDKCPELPGIKKYDGCPDTDGDSIIDPEDLCPETPGPRSLQGCPDTDNDGLLDYIDACPELAGPKENSGCPWPDTDEDGILDREDKCPTLKGPKENNGCPYADTDNDGVLDKDDDCPNVPGLVENKGCPKIDKKEEEILKTAFDNLQFETGKDIIKEESFPSLDSLGMLLRDKRPEWKLKLEGHTDNVGTEQNNLILSKKRAEAVQKYLVKQGVSYDRIKVEYYGEMRPIADNDTKEGRAKNRRVEMEILFE